MAGGHNHITYWQILETELRLKVASILKLFINTPDGIGTTSLKFFLKSFSSGEVHSNASFNLTDYSKDLNEISNIHLDVTTLQSLAFVTGFSVYSYFKHSKCESCLEKIEIDDVDNKYTLISLLDRGSLIWLSDRVLEATISLENSC